LELNGSHPEETIIRKGAPMVYGITIPKSAASPEWAARFVVFVLGPEGRRIMEANNQPEIVPARVDNFEALPLIVRPFVRDRNIES
jgi:molybdate/tungstate transport system substrate-binding protein